MQSRPRASGLPARGASAISRVPGTEPRELGERSTCDRLAEDRPHACPHRLRAEGVSRSGAEDDSARNERQRRTHDGSDVAGIRHLVQVDGNAGRPAVQRRRLAAPIRRSAVIPSQASRQSEAHRPRTGTTSTSAGRFRSTGAPASSSSWSKKTVCGRAPQRSASASMSSPSARNSFDRSRCLRSWSFRSSLRRRVLWARDRHSGKTKKRRHLCGPRPVESTAACGFANRQPSPPGTASLAPQIGGRSRGRSRRCPPASCGLPRPRSHAGRPSAGCRRCPRGGQPR